MFADQRDLPEGRPEVIARFRSQEFVDELRRSEVIRGVDEETGVGFIAFGLSTVKAIAATKRSMECVYAEIPLLTATSELEALLAAVEVAKGYHDYRDTFSNKHQEG